MKIIERSHINITKWNALVSRTAGAQVFSISWYLDSVAENWCILVDDDYSRGIALPYSKRAGLEVLYSPIFGRNVQMIGSLTADELKIIQNRFKIIEFASEQDLFGIGEMRIHQVIPEDRKLGSQAKRSIKKAGKSGLTLVESWDYSEVIKTVNEELNHKFSGVTEASLKALERLFESAKEARMIKVFNVQSNALKGGIVCFEFNGQLLYVKGAVDEETKSNGGMYLALNAAIEYAAENQLKFDFGGSNVDGVKKFNYNLGGIDEPYFMSIQNNGPVWFKIARKLKARLIGN